MEKWCFECKYCIMFKKGLFLCALAHSFIPNIKLGANCEFYRKGEYVLDNLHDNNAMVRSIKENDQDVSKQE